jgi:colanic acid biosynthesis protein WcaH
MFDALQQREDHLPLNDQQLLEVIERTPLVSIDLIVRDTDNRILLGLRNREPAKDTWFVPGGRILKNEQLDDAFMRVSSKELGVQYTRPQARLLGIFDNIYDTNYQEGPGIGTHYVVLAYEIRPSHLPQRLPIDQHREYRWFTCTEAAHTKDLHKYVLPYFLLSQHEASDGSNERFLAQYAALNARRNSLNTLLWQTPAVSLTAQAFLFTIALRPGVSCTAQRFAAGLALIAAAASIQLMTKHRFGEKDTAKQLRDMENQGGLDPINERRVPTLTWSPESWLAKFPSYWVWLVMLGVFAGAASAILFKWFFNWTCT